MSVPIRLTLISMVAFAVILAVQGTASDLDRARADDCGTFEVSPAADATAVVPPKYVMVVYKTCHAGGSGGLGLAVDAPAEPSGGGQPFGGHFEPSPAELSMAVGFRTPLLPGVHAAVATASERACAECEWVSRTYEWTFTVGGPGRAVHAPNIFE